MSEFWYYAEGDETRGPIAFDQLIKLLSQLRTPGGVLVWREGFNDWQATENVREIVEKLIRPPPLRPRSSFTTPAITETITEAAVEDTVAPYQQQFRDDKSLQEGRETVARYQEQFQKAKPAPTPQQSGPTGLGGWLALLGFGLAVAPVNS